ncbi:MAG: hypothetical protein KatS3mg050_2615 [Litorilinea sp.]|nr:MAG: hypothetical protein KatS3mg050_2615 [Litorilinea sp.]
MPREIEAKLRPRHKSMAPEEVQQAAQALDGYRFQPQREVELWDGYFDTDAYDLIRHGYVLRLRRVDGQILAGLKGIPLRRGAVVERLEVEVPLPADTPLPPPAWPPAIQEVLDGLGVEETPLRLLCLLQQRRSKGLLWPQVGVPELDGQAGPLAELSLDRVSVYPPEATAGATHAQPGAQPWHQFEELELELLADSEADALRPLVRQLRKALGLKVARENKLETALRALSQLEPTPAGPVAGIQPEMPVAEACRLIWRVQLMQLVLNEHGARSGRDPEYIHDMRVAIRRARTVQRLFVDHWRRKRVRPFLKRMKQAGRALGRVRDLDVGLAGLARGRKSWPGMDGQVLRQLRRAWRQQRQQEHAALVAFLDREEWRQFIQELDRFCRTPGAGTPKRDRAPGEALHPYQVRHVFPNTLWHHFSLIRSAEALLDQGVELSAETLHGLRVECKYLRYGLEFSRHLLGEEGEALIRQLKGLQDYLGHLNDRVVACKRLQKWQARQDGSGPLDAWIEGEMGEIAGMVQEFPGHFRHFIRPENRRRLAIALARL